MGKKAHKGQFGPTGKFPQGSLGPHDDGELQMGVARDSKGNVVINFGIEVSWLAFPPEGAINLAKLLLKHAGAQRVEVSFGDPKEEVALSRDQLAQLIYEVEPYEEPGEYVDGFQVSPGGKLSWNQVKARDAEFSGMAGMGSITEYAYRCADAIIAWSPKHELEPNLSSDSGKSGSAS